MTQASFATALQGHAVASRGGAVSPASYHLIVDALLRFAAGTDDGDAALLGSVFTPEAVVDFGPCGRKLGMVFDPLIGAPAIVGFLGGTSRRQVTSHVITNPRVRLDGGRAQLRALVEATHVARDDRARRFRMMNRYDVELELRSDDWRIARMTIDGIWFEGDPAVLGLRGPAA